MGKLMDGVVLDNQLFKKYHDFLDGTKKVDQSIRKLFHYMKGGRIISTVEQYDETGVNLQSGLRKNLIRNGLSGVSLNVLAMNTPYKVILSETNSVFPYVNVIDENEKIENDFVGSYEKNEDRFKAIAHLKALCDNASHITIYDKYISDKETLERSNLNFLEKILPKKRLIIDCYFLSDNGLNDLTSRCADWIVAKVPGSASRHDRYIIIDDKVEVILTSGLYHADNLGMDFTYIVRYVGKGKTRF